MVDEATAVLEAVADDSWITWGTWVIPNVVTQMRVEEEVRAWMEAGGGHQDVEGGVGSGSASKALELLFAVEAEKDTDEDFAHQEAHLQEKLEVFLDERITQEKFEKDSEGEMATAERSEVMGDEETSEAET